MLPVRVNGLLEEFVHNIIISNEIERKLDLRAAD